MSYLLLPHAGEKLRVLVASRERLHRDEVVRDTAHWASGDSGEEVRRPAEHKVRDEAGETVYEVAHGLAEQLACDGQASEQKVRVVLVS